MRMMTPHRHSHLFATHHMSAEVNANEGHDARDYSGFGNSCLSK